MNDVSVIHLVRACNGIEPFKRFLQSYSDHHAGMDHELVIVLKGFCEKQFIESVNEILTALPHKSLVVEDHGFDIGAYYTASLSVESRYLCFVNSFSEILVDNWLLYLYKHIVSEGVGMAGATGSWESMYSNNISLGLIKGGLSKEMLMRMWNLAKLWAWFDPFPNPHLRTNGFIISRDLFLSIKHGELKNKMDAHRYESGKEGLSSQIRKMGLKLILVGRNGQGFTEDKWASSGTFRLGEQDNLLLADNQTNGYQHADIETRKKLTRCSWMRTN